MIIALIYTDTWLKKVNDLGVKMYCKKRGLPYNEAPNHVEIVMGSDTYGAVPKRVRKMKFSEYVNSLKGSLLRYELIEIDCTESEFKEVKSFLNSMLGTRYEYLMIISHFFNIVFGFWLGRRRKKAVTCVELAIRALNKIKGYNLDVTLNMYEFKNKLLT